MYANECIKKYIEDLSSRKATPGGGSAAALSGAIGVSLLEMACNFTIGNKKYEASEKEVCSCAETLKKTKEEFIFLTDEDVKVYSCIRDAFGSKDPVKIENALKDGWSIAYKVCSLSAESMSIACNLADKANPNLITDVGCGAELLKAAFSSSVFNMNINLKGIKDDEFKKRSKDNACLLKERIEADYIKTISITRKRMG